MNPSFEFNLAYSGLKRNGAIAMKINVGYSPILPSQLRYYSYMLTFENAVGVIHTAKPLVSVAPNTINLNDSCLVLQLSLPGVIDVIAY